MIYSMALLIRAFYLPPKVTVPLMMNSSNMAEDIDSKLYIVTPELQERLYMNLNVYLRVLPIS